MFFVEGLDLEDETVKDRSKVASVIIALATCVGGGVAFGLAASGLLVAVAS